MMGITLAKQATRVAGVKNPIAFLITCPLNWRSATTYEVRAVIQKEGSYRAGTLQVLLTLSDQPDANNQVTFDLSHILETFVDADPPPSAGAQAARICQKMDARYAVSFQEVSNGSIIDAEHVLFNHVILGGRNEYEGQKMKPYFEAGLFLTWQPRTKYVTADQPEWLSLGIPESVGTDTLSLYADVIFEDGSEDTDNDLGLDLFVQSYDVAQWPAGYNQLGLSAITGSAETSGYRLYVKNSSGDVVSEVMTYSFQGCECSPLDRFFLFQNSLGGIDTVRTRGEGKTTVVTSGQQAQRMLSPFRTGTERALLDYGKSLYAAHEQEVGISSEEEQMWLRDFLLAEHVWKVGESYFENPDAGGILVPVSIETGSTQIFQDNDYIHTLTFSYRESTQHRAI